jgi:hypothetical protein
VKFQLIKVHGANSARTISNDFPGIGSREYEETAGTIRMRLPYQGNAWAAVKGQGLKAGRQGNTLWKTSITKVQR